MRRLPSLWNENRSMERGFPSLCNKISITQKPVSKTSSGSKPTNGSSWRQSNSTNGYHEAVSNDLLQSYDQKVQECFKLQETVTINELDFSCIPIPVEDSRILRPRLVSVVNARGNL
nr:hypothetical protein HmN_000455200 [Hymenolepis microstoma]